MAAWLGYLAEFLWEDLPVPALTPYRLEAGVWSPDAVCKEQLGPKPLSLVRPNLEMTSI